VIDCLPSLVIGGWLLAFTGDCWLAAGLHLLLVSHAATPTSVLSFPQRNIRSAPHRLGYKNQIS
jgi:hypothetical protein